MAANTSEIGVLITGKDELSPNLAKIESQIIRFVGAISAAIAGIKLGAAPIIAAANFERELANVAKTTNFTSSEIAKLGKNLTEISLQVDVSAVDLAKIAAAAGQQGLGKTGVAGITQFTDSVARMSSVLGITADEAAVNIGKIINVFKLPLSQIEKATSVFNEISNNSTANGKELLDVVKRIGDAAGALNLQQASALAATGLDFGLSPEVVGTSISRVFSAAFEKADQFGKLMNISALDWTKKLKTDGLGAFKDFIAGLRKLDSVSQQNAIVKLVGGGRIGAFINKLIQDTTDSVLTRNFASAEEGNKGFSALKEQQTVLNTLEAQAKILQNSFVKLGIDSAQSLLGPLTQYTAQLSAALQEPAVKSFVNAAVQSLGQLIETLVSAVKYVASLNINWENFFKVLQAFIGLKLAETFIGIASKFGLFSAGLKSVSKDAKDAAAATDKFGRSSAAAGKGGDAGAQQFKASTAARLLGYEELSIANKKRLADLAAEKLAEDAVLKAARNADATQKAVKPALADKAKAQTGADVATNRVQQAQSDVLFQKSAVLAAEQKQQQALDALRTAGDARAIKAAEFTKNKLAEIDKTYNKAVIDQLNQQAAAKAASAAADAKYNNAVRDAANNVRQPGAALTQSTTGANLQRLKEEADYQKQRLALIEAGSAEELALLSATRAEQIAQQQKFNEIALANIRATYVKRLAQLEAIGTAEVAAEKAILAERLAAFDRFVAAQTIAQEKLSVANAAAAQAGAVAAGAATELQAAKTSAALAGAATSTEGIFARMAGSLTTAFGAIGLGLRTLASVAAVAGRVILSAFFWVTLAFQILDFLGVMDKLAPVIQKVTDFLGLTSVAQRDAKLAAEAHTEALRKQQEELDAATKSYNSYLDAFSRKVDPTKIQAKTQLQNVSDDPNIRQNSAKDLADFVAGAQSAIERATNLSKPAIASAIAANKTVIEQAQKDLEKLKERQANIKSAIAGGTATNGAQDRVDALQSAIDVKSQSITDATQKIADLNSALNDSAGNAQLVQDNIRTAFVEIGKNITPVALEVLENVILPMKEADEKVAALTEQIKKVGDAARKEGVDAKAAIAPLQAQFEAATKAAGDYGNAYHALAALAQGDLKNFTVQDAAAISRLGDNATTSAKSIRALVAAGKTNKDLLTGTNKGFVTPKASGDGKFSRKDGESAAERLAKAELEIARAKIQAQNHLADEQSKQLLEIEDDRYKKGLSGLRDYYTAREQISIDATNRDIADKKREIVEAQKEQKKVAKDPAKVAGTQAKIEQLKGQIAVLEEQKIGLAEATKRDLRDADETFKKELLSSTNNLFAEGVLPANTATIFQSNLDELTTQYKDFLAKLRTTGNGALADALVKSFNIEAFKKSLAQATQQIDLTFAEIDRFSTRANIARQQGQVGTFETGERINDQIKAQIPLLQQQLKLMQDQLAVLGQTVGTGTLAYQQQAAAVDNLILKLEQLSVETDKQAQSINQGLTDNLEKALNNLQPTFKSLKETVLQLLLDIANQIKGLFAKQIAEEITKALGSVAGKGFGEIIANQLKTGFASNAASGVGIDAAKAGFSAAKDTGLVVAKTATSTVTDTAGSAAAGASLQAIVAPAGEAALALGTLTAPAGEATLSLSTVAVPAGEAAIGLTSIFAPAGEAAIALAALVGPATAAAAALASAAGSSTASTIATVAAVAHTGGKVGGGVLRTRRVDPAVFTNAVRYHSGGIAGLRPNEVPTILEKGEHVLTARQAAQQKAAQTGGAPVSIRSVLVTDPNFVPDAMATSQGERTLMTILKRNQATLKQLVS